MLTVIQSTFQYRCIICDEDVSFWLVLSHLNDWFGGTENLGTWQCLWHFMISSPNLKACDWIELRIWNGVGATNDLSECKWVQGVQRVDLWDMRGTLLQRVQGSKRSRRYRAWGVKGLQGVEGPRGLGYNGHQEYRGYQGYRYALTIQRHRLHKRYRGYGRYMGRVWGVQRSRV